MKQNKILFLTCMFAVSFGLTSFADAKENGEIEVDVLYFNGDIADYSGIKFVVYQGQNKEPVIEKTAASNPETLQLPADKEYKIEVYSNDMFAGFKIVKLDTARKDVDINIPLSGGLQIQVFYNDKATPVSDATVAIKSHKGNEWRKGQTNDSGKTLRFWIQSTNREDNYYVADVYLGDKLVKSSNPINLQPGIQTNVPIILPVPKIVQDLITVSIYKNSEKVTNQAGNYNVILKDQVGNAIKSNVSFRGDAHFSLLKPAKYAIIVESPPDESELWPETNVFIMGKQNQFNVFMSTPIVVDEIMDSEKPRSSCDCIAFRLDDVQDYWLNNVQTHIIEQFVTNDIPITLGIIADSFGNDPMITDYVKSNLDKATIASHGVGTSPLTEFDKPTQEQLIKQSVTEITNTVGISPQIFIPPQNRFNQDTIDVLIDNGFTHLSGSILHGDMPPFPLTGEILYRFPESTTTGQYDPDANVFRGMPSNQTISEAIGAIDSFGFAVITMHPQEFSITQDGVYTNNVNEQSILELQKTINDLRALGYTFVTIDKINIDSDIAIPSWIKNNASWWAKGQIDDKTFVNSLQFLLKEGIIIVPDASQSEQTADDIPEWIKNNASWWAANQISDSDFIKGIEFLIANGIIKY